MARTNRITRRAFLRGAAAGAAAAPLVVAAEAFGANDRIQLAGIGLGGRGNYVFSNLARRDGV